MKIRKVLVYACLALMASASVVRAQSLGVDPRVRDAVHLLGRWIDAQREYTPFPGISVAVVHDQEVIWSEGFGYEDLESRRPASPETVYSVCSIYPVLVSD